MHLGEDGRPCDLLNVAGYYALLLSAFDHMLNRGFISLKHRAMVLVETDLTALLESFKEYRPPKTPKWIDRSETYNPTLGSTETADNHP